MIKKASSHVEMVISFVLFVLFISFILFYVKPYKQNSLGESIIDGLQDSFILKAKTQLTTVFLKTSSTGQCFSINLPGLSGKSIVKSALNSVEKESSFSGGVLSVNSGADSFYIYISDEFNQGTYTCVNSITQQEYTLGSIVSEDVLSSLSLESLKVQYTNDYSGLKRNLGVPDSVDFSVSSGNFSLEKQIPQKTSVFSKTFTQKVLDSNGNIETKDFLLRVW